MAKQPQPIDYLSFNAQQGGGEAFVVQRVNVAMTQENVRKRAEAVNDILLSAWQRKTVRSGRLAMSALVQRIPTVHDLMEGMAAPADVASYYLAMDPPLSMSEANPDTTTAFARVETYHRRTPFAKDYPNITDLESNLGQVCGGQTERRTAALVYCALSGYDNGRKVAAYELEGSDGIGFYENLGFEQTGNRPSEKVGDGSVTYVHLQATSIGGVNEQIRTQYPGLIVPSPI